MKVINVGVVGGGDHARMSIYPSIRHAGGGSPTEGLPSLVASHRNDALSPLTAELVAVAEHKRPLAERIASFHGAREVYTSHTELLVNSDIDCVLIVLHPKVQWEVAVECLEAGKDVWVEKPPAESVPHALEMKKAAEKNGRILMVGFMKRYSQVYRKAREIVKSKEFGKLSVYEARYTYGQYPIDVYNFLNGFAIHHLDLPRFFCGDIESVVAQHVSRGKGLDGYCVLVRFVNNSIGILNLNCLEGKHTNMSERVAISGVGSRVVVDGWRRLVADLPDQDDTYYWEPDDIQPADTSNGLFLHGFVPELKEFFDCVAQRRIPESNIDNAVAAIALQKAVEISIAEKRLVHLGEVYEKI